MPPSARAAAAPPVSSPSKLAEDLHAQMNAARKAQDKARALLLGTTLAALKNREIELRRPATDAEVVEVLRKGIKTRRESVEQYLAGKRQDLADKESAEIRMLEEFLPPEADPAERPYERLCRAGLQEACFRGGGWIDLHRAF